MILFPPGFDFHLLFTDYLSFAAPFLIPTVIGGSFVLIVKIIKQAKKV